MSKNIDSFVFPIDVTEFMTVYDRLTFEQSLEDGRTFGDSLADVGYDVSKIVRHLESLQVPMIGD